MLTSCCLNVPAIDCNLKLFAKRNTLSSKLLFLVTVFYHHNINETRTPGLSDPLISPPSVLPKFQPQEAFGPNHPAPGVCYSLCTE